MNKAPSSLATVFALLILSLSSAYPVLGQGAMPFPGANPGYCGNGICDAGEAFYNCPEDCKCGNAICDSGESISTCPADCRCGDGFCGAMESHTSCPVDCAPPTSTPTASPPPLAGAMAPPTATSTPTHPPGGAMAPPMPTATSTPSGPAGAMPPPPTATPTPGLIYIRVNLEAKTMGQEFSDYVITGRAGHTITVKWSTTTAQVAYCDLRFSGDFSNANDLVVVTPISQIPFYPPPPAPPQSIDPLGTIRVRPSGEIVLVPKRDGGLYVRADCYPAVDDPRVIPGQASIVVSVERAKSSSADLRAKVYGVETDGPIMEHDSRVPITLKVYYPAEALGPNFYCYIPNILRDANVQILGSVSPPPGLDQTIHGNMVATGHLPVANLAQFDIKVNPGITKTIELKCVDLELTEPSYPGKWYDEITINTLPGINQNDACNILCLCRYETFPECEAATTKEQCEGVRIAGRQECSWVSGTKCISRFQLVCTNWLAGLTCTKKVSKPYSDGLEAAIGSIPDKETYSTLYYMEDKHSTPEMAPAFINDALVNIPRRFPNMDLVHASNHGCATFENQSSARSLVRSALESMAPRKLSGEISGNQLTSFSSALTGEEWNPSWTVHFLDGAVAGEDFVSCNASMICDQRIRNQHYLCETATGIERRTCCCNGPQNGDCALYPQLLACPMP